MNTRILKPGRNCRSLIGCKGSGLLVDGRDYYNAFYSAALKAEKYILISGWQFDSEVELLRGPRPKNGRVRFLEFLNGLCARNRELRVYILAWDFSLIFMLEREWVQEWVFNWQSGERLFFRFDDRHALGASQHQKYTVIDGCTAFIGGMDLCAGRWDDRRHLAVNRERVNPDGRTYEPYHDIQAYATGPVAKVLSGLFAQRWKNLTGEELSLSSHTGCAGHMPRATGISVEAGETALSLTQGYNLSPLQEPVHEIRALYIDAIKNARRLIYMENQYLSSYAVYKALLDRFSDGGKPGLEVVIVLPKHPHGFLEELSLGITQSKLLQSLKERADAHGHSLGIYYPAVLDGNGAEVNVYIHSKLIIVDDRFLSTGSANTTNRSMGLDTELNISWEAASARDLPLAKSIKAARVNLVAEHSGVDNEHECALLATTKGLVRYLDSLAERPEYTLRKHHMSTYLNGTGLIKGMDNLILDPERPFIEESLYELLSPVRNSLFAEGITFLKKWFFG